MTKSEKIHILSRLGYIHVTPGEDKIEIAVDDSFELMEFSLTREEVEDLINALRDAVSFSR